MVLTFNTDRDPRTTAGELSAEAYTDDGRPIFWCWTTPFDALGQPNRVKRDNKRAAALELKSMSHGQVKGQRCAPTARRGRNLCGWMAGISILPI